MTPDMDQSLHAAAHAARCVVAVTGAGISAPSGIATYRAEGSNWTDPNIEKMSHASRYGNYLEVLWERMWGPLVSTTTAAVPNPGHAALTTWQAHLRAHGGDLHVITQNIDGLHQRAGTRDVTEIHGTLARVRCLRCRTTSPTPAPVADQPGPPTCPSCGSPRVRPDVVLFGERLHAPTVRATEALIARADLYLAVGTSGIVHPVAAWTGLAAAHRVPTVLIDPTHRDGFDHHLPGDSAQSLPALVSTAIA